MNQDGYYRIMDSINHMYHKSAGSADPTGFRFFSKKIQSQHNATAFLVSIYRTADGCALPTAWFVHQFSKPQKNSGYE